MVPPETTRADTPVRRFSACLAPSPKIASISSHSAHSRHTVKAASPIVIPVPLFGWDLVGLDHEVAARARRVDRCAELRRRFSSASGGDERDLSDGAGVAVSFNAVILDQQRFGR
jgi:hypothetical protein